ncbi:MAG: hypothetical protein JWR05_1946 [Mucilaginibacter sp.]|nr:hypothetical protein [Mucilaginibacter sp.]
MASRNGLNPKIRGLKGVGFNRALPAPFGWENGIQGDGNNDYLLADLSSKTITSTTYTLEYWVKPMSGTNSNWVISFVGNAGSYCGLYCSNTTMEIYENGGRVYNFDISALYGTRIHVVLSVDNGSYSVFINGFAYRLNITRTTNSFFKYLTLCGAVQAYGGAFGSYSNLLIDEFRFYTEAVTQQDAFTNYNYGLGNNPCRTEYLDIWYQFEKFELLDFSSLQDGSDMRLGIRDMSGSKNHSQQFNMITDNSNANYVIKPF